MLAPERVYLAGVEACGPQTDMPCQAVSGVRLIPKPLGLYVNLLHV